MNGKPENSTIRVLLIEDDKVDQMAFKRLVKDENLLYDYIIAGSVAGAKRVLESERFDVIIADYALGDGTAFDIFDSVIDTPIVFVTGGGDEEAAVKAMKAGAYDYLIKDRGRNYLKVLPVTVESAIKHKKAEIQYRMLSHAIMSINDNVYITDMDNRIIFVNKAFCQTYGYKEEEIFGRHNNILWKRKAKEKNVQNILSKTIECGPRGEFNHRRKDGSIFPVSLSRSVIKDEEGNEIAVIEVTRDISEEKRVEEEKKSLQSQVLQTQKMEAIGVLAGGVAHDFNNLLTAIQGYAEMGLMNLAETDPLYEDLKQIQVVSKRAANLTRQLLLFSRKHPTKLISINLNKTIKDLSKMLHRLIGENIKINIDLEPALWTVKADRGTVEQVIMNLVINAKDAIIGSGEITLKTGNIVLDKECCRNMSKIQPGKFVRLSIEDTGIGMNKQTQQHIFEPFFSTKDPNKGTGLGLSVVYGIIQQHNGCITVYSESGHGTVFKIYIPVVFEDMKEEVEEEISPETLQGSGERVLVVEDEEDVRELIRRVLNKNGYVVSTAASAEEALDVFEEEKGDFHLVFSDVMLPKKTGIELVNDLLSQHPDLRVLLGSGYTDHKSQWPLIQEKGLRFIQKPYSLMDMLRVVKEAVKLGSGLLDQ